MHLLKRHGAIRPTQTFRVDGVEIHGAKPFNPKRARASRDRTGHLAFDLDTSWLDRVLQGSTMNAQLETV